MKIVGCVILERGNIGISSYSSSKFNVAFGVIKDHLKFLSGENYFVSQIASRIIEIIIWVFQKGLSLM